MVGLGGWLVTPLDRIGHPELHESGNVSPKYQFTYRVSKERELGMSQLLGRSWKHEEPLEDGAVGSSANTSRCLGAGAHSSFQPLAAIRAQF